MDIVTSPSVAERPELEATEEPLPPESDGFPEEDRPRPPTPDWDYPEQEQPEPEYGESEPEPVEPDEYPY